MKIITHFHYYDKKRVFIVCSLATLFLFSFIGYITAGTLPSQESMSLSYELVEHAPGDYDVEINGATGSFKVIVPNPSLKPAELVVIGMEISQNSMTRGDDFMIFVTVMNYGEETGTRTIDLSIDSAKVDSQEVTLLGDTSITLTFTLTADYIEGSHTASADDRSVSFIVKEPPTQIPWFTIITTLVILIAIIIYILYEKGVIS